jgi:hypothetical protein
MPLNTDQIIMEPDREFFIKPLNPSTTDEKLFATLERKFDPVQKFKTEAMTNSSNCFMNFVHEYHMEILVFMFILLVIFINVLMTKNNEIRLLSRLLMLSNHPQITVAPPPSIHASASPATPST